MAFSGFRKKKCLADLSYCLYHHFANLISEGCILMSFCLRWNGSFIERKPKYKLKRLVWCWDSSKINDNERSEGWVKPHNTRFLES